MQFEFRPCYQNYDKQLWNLQEAISWNFYFGWHEIRYATFFQQKKWNTYCYNASDINIFHTKGIRSVVEMQHYKRISDNSYCGIVGIVGIHYWITYLQNLKSKLWISYSIGPSSYVQLARFWFYLDNIEKKYSERQFANIYKAVVK